MAKITKATFKSFIKNNKDKLYISVRSEFDGMTDCCESTRDSSFKLATYRDFNNYTLGINGVWLVGTGGNRFQDYEDDKFKGIEVNNCCGRFIVAIIKWGK